MPDTPQQPAGLLLIADVHFGKAASFRRLGVPVPQGTTEANLARIEALLARLSTPDGGSAVRRIVFLGDFLHAASGRAPATLQALADWRARHADLPMTLVRGNHDSHAGDPPPALAIDVVDEPWVAGGLALCHHPDLHPDALNATGRYAIAGHVHPVARLGRGFDSLRLPCFHARAGVMVLPAFGAFTGGAMTQAAPGEAIYLVAGERAVRAPG